MRQMAELVFLGTGASTGIPLIGCTCSVCSHADGPNVRLRPSVFLKIENKQFVIDVGPDFRTQALKYGIKQLDGVLITHVHFDHIAGIDDLRAYYFLQKRPMPCLISETDFDLLKGRYGYLFQKPDDKTVGIARIDFQVLGNEQGHQRFEGVQVQYMTFDHGNMQVTGYRFGDLAYITDIKEYDDSLLECLRGINTLIVSALRHEHSSVHFTVDEAVKFAQVVGAKQTYLTHIAHEIDHESTDHDLPEGIQIAYDGLKVKFNL